MPISSYGSKAAGHGRRRAAARDLRERLSTAGLMPTRQRLAIARLLYGRGHRHLTPGELYQEARKTGLGVSRATVYNTLHAFVTHGLLREIPVEPNKSYFDTNLAHVCHAFFAETGELRDLQPTRAELARVSAKLGGVDFAQMNIVIYIDGRARRRPRPAPEGRARGKS